MFGSYAGALVKHGCMDEMSICTVMPLKAAANTQTAMQLDRKLAF